MAVTIITRKDVAVIGAGSLTVGFTFFLIVALLGGLGFLADSLLGTLPLFLLVGIVVGFAAGLYYLYCMIKRMGDG